MTLLKTMPALLNRSWWRYSASEPWGFSQGYHWFNVAEGIAWCVVAVLAMRRFLAYRKSRFEIAYTLAFVTFGLSDFVEARLLTTWLILVKGANLVLLFILRSYLTRRFYPESKTY